VRFCGTKKRLRSAVKRVSNHTQIVLSVDPEAVYDWNDDEVADRWLRVFPGAMAQATSEEHRQRVRMGLLSTPDRLKEVRERLGSLSWFMRSLNEPIARMANQEDNCSGRFWEGRFKCQALLEPQAVVSAMAYVDLNPARARMADTLEESDLTSIKSRLESRTSGLGKNSGLTRKRLKPVAGLDAEALLDTTESSYIELVQWTGEQFHPMKRGKLISRSDLGGRQPEVLLKLSNHSDRWIRQVRGTESKYYRAIGSAEALMAKAAELGQRWMQGVFGERAWMILRSQAK